MLVTITIPSSRGASAQFFISIIFPRCASSPVVKETVTEYLRLLQTKFKLSKVSAKKMDSNKVVISCSVKKLVNREQQMTDNLFLSYLLFLGFVTLKTIHHVEQMERIEIVRIFEEANSNYANQARINHFRSRKVLAKRSDIAYLHNKLYFTRGAIEELAYSDEKNAESWFDTIQEIDFLIDNLEGFVWDFKITCFINKAVKSKLNYYSEFYDNVRIAKKSYTEKN